jgi:hypothetical protein
MSSVITQTPMPDPNAVARPLLVLGYETEWTAGNTLHDIVGTNIPVPTLPVDAVRYRGHGPGCR